MSILSISSTVKATESVRSAVYSVSRRRPRNQLLDEDLNHTKGDDISVPYCILRPAGESVSTIEVESLVDHGDGMTWDSLLAKLPRDQCRMIVANVPWISYSDGVLREKVVFIQWTPSDTTVKQRMTASLFSKGAKRVIDDIVGPSMRIEADGLDCLDLSEVQHKIRSKMTVH